MKSDETKTSAKARHAATDPKLAISVTPRLRTIAQLRKKAAECRACDLWKTATQTVFGEGPSPVKVMLVGEQPGEVLGEREQTEQGEFGQRPGVDAGGAGHGDTAQILL